MERNCSTGQSLQRAVVPTEEEKDYSLEITGGMKRLRYPLYVGSAWLCMCCGLNWQSACALAGKIESEARKE